jgi:AraC-like DNA-binding protein
VSQDINWAAIRADYENGLSLRALAAKYHVSKSAIGERKYKEKWDQFRTDNRTDTDNSKGTTRDVNAVARVQAAIKLYLEKRPTWEEIAARCGYGSRGAAHNAVMRELGRCITHDVKSLRDEELYMIQQLQSRCYQAGMDKNNDAWTWAIDRFAVLSKRKSELMGMDVKPEELLANQNYIKKIVIVDGGADEHAND